MWSHVINVLPRDYLICFFFSLGKWMDFWGSSNALYWNWFTVSTNIEIATLRRNLSKNVTSWRNILWLQLKKKAAINAISPDFDKQWNGILKKAEGKLLRLLLNETRQIYVNTEIECNEAIQSTFPKICVLKKELFQK